MACAGLFLVFLMPPQHLTLLFPLDFVPLSVCFAGNCYSVVGEFGIDWNGGLAQKTLQLLEWLASPKDPSDWNLVGIKPSAALGLCYE